VGEVERARLNAALDLLNSLVRVLEIDGRRPQIKSRAIPFTPHPEVKLDAVPQGHRARDQVEDRQLDRRTRLEMDRARQQHDQDDQGDEPSTGRPSRSPVERFFGDMKSQFDSKLGVRSRLKAARSFSPST